MLAAAIADDDPVLFVEHKLLYPRPLLEAGAGELVDFQVTRGSGPYPCFRLQPAQPARLTLATYGYNFELVRQAALELVYEREIFAEIVLFSQLSPFELGPLFESLARTRRLLTVEEGTLTLGWGAEVAARAVEALDGLRVRRAAALDLPIANSKPLEDAILPSPERIVRAALSLLQENPRSNPG